MSFSPQPGVDREAAAQMAMEPHDDYATHNEDPSGAPGGGEGEGAEGGFILPEVSAVMHEVQAFFTAQLLPRCRNIENDVAALTYEANSVTERASSERAGVEKELARLSNLVVAFQQRISQFLHFGSFGNGGL